MPDFERFFERVDRLVVDMTEHKVQMGEVQEALDVASEQAATAEGNAKWAKRVVVGAILVGLVGVLVGWVALDTAQDNKRIAQQQAADRTEARSSSCIQTNLYTQKNREALVAGLLAIFPDSSHLTSEQQAAVDRYRSGVEEALPYRDCSRAGIDAYYERPPADPAALED